MSDPNKHLERQFQNGRVILFVGAGFSRACSDLDHKPLPTGPALAREVWDIAFPGESFDETNTLQDIFEVAQRRHPKQLISHLNRRLSVDATSIPRWYEIWLSQPWRRVYTLNVDDLFQAAQSRFSLPREFDSISALEPREDYPWRSWPKLEVVHLNGRLSDGLDKMTFATTQYADRSSAQEPWHVKMAVDLNAYPVLFVGTPLEDQLLWQHLQLRGKRGPRNLAEMRPRSYLISPAIPKAKEELLKSFNIELLKMTADQFANTVLQQFKSSISIGLKALEVEGRPTKGTPAQVTSPASRGSRKSSFLLGAEPEWEDIAFGLAIRRGADVQIRAAIDDKRRNIEPLGIVVITGTAGSGKTTSLMRAALEEVATGRKVAWVGRNEDVSPRDLRSWADHLDTPHCLYIDEVDRYGTEAHRILDAVRHKPMIESVVVAIRSAKVERVLDVPVLSGVTSEIAMPSLTDDDIDGLLSVLRLDGKLGKMRALSLPDQREVLREKCGRLLLVAMLEATNSQRFEEKVIEEYSELGEVAQTIYELVSVSYERRYAIPKTMLLLAIGDASNDALNALDALERRQLIVLDGGRYRPRHRVIAETLIQHLQEVNQAKLARTTARLAYAMAVHVVPPPDRSNRDWRFLISLLNHARLLRAVGIDGARGVYEEIESLIHYDHHYWLQRGSLELEIDQGKLAFAENYLLQARSLDSDDYKIQTAYAHMLIKKAVAAPARATSEGDVDAAVDILEDLIEARGAHDYYVYHVLGSQGLGWVRKSETNNTSKELLLRRLVAHVQDGVNRHPRSGQLSTLLTDLRRALLEITTGLVPALAKT